MRKICFYNDGYYHVYNRGVDLRRIFMDEMDYRRFFESMYLFNDSNHKHRSGREVDRTLKLSAHEILQLDREPLVDILSYCLIPNHFHIFLRQVQDGGVSHFLHGLGMGYAKYFNLRHKRTGSLFEGAYKVVHVKNEAHYYHVPRYIHLNALDEIDPKWRNGLVDNWEEAMEFIDSYRWSSHHTYMGREQLLPVVERQDLLDELQDVSNYEKYLREWAGRNTMPYLPPDCPSLGDGPKMPVTE
ncbi:MAG: transposase [Candidatus Uhrbacteria bacterium]|nr:transposase [Candidatus Uhrbacteria bacterium]